MLKELYQQGRKSKDLRYKQIKDFFDKKEFHRQPTEEEELTDRKLTYSGTTLDNDLPDNRMTYSAGMVNALGWSKIISDPV